MKISLEDLKRILRLAYPERSRLIWGGVFLAIGSAVTLYSPQAVRQLIDNAVQSKDTSQLDKAALIVLVLFLIQSISGTVRYYLFTLAGERVVLRLRQNLYEKILKQEIGFFDARKTGELMNRLSSDTTILQNAVSVNISMALRNLASAVGGIALLIYTSPILTLSMLAVVPPILLGAAIFGKRIRELSKKTQDALAEAGAVAQETIAGARTVHSFAKVDHEVRRYRSTLDRALEITRSRIWQVSNFMGIASTIGFAAIACVLWYGGRMAMNGEMTLGSLMSFMLYMLFVAFSVGALGGLWTDFMSAIGAAKRVFELLDREPLIKSQDGEDIENIKGHIQFENVSFHYPSRPEVEVLKNIKLEIRPGEVVALVGPSGGGKTTLAQLIPRFYDPTSGHIKIDGRELKSLKAESLRRFIGTVAQDPILFSTSIRENILYGRHNATPDEVLAASKVANAYEFVSRLPEQFETLVGERGVQLSGGQKQRVAIARAVLSDPRILILDEATSSLDAESEHLVKEALDRLMKGRTTLVIAHRLSTVRDADRVLVVENGQIVQVGKHDELMKVSDGIYSKLVNRQFLQIN